jgi:hypothetical protein
MHGQKNIKPQKMSFTVHGFCSVSSIQNQELTESDQMKLAMKAYRLK